MVNVSNAPADTPQWLIGSSVHDYTRVNEKIFWHTPAFCPPPPPHGPAALSPETIQRTSVYGYPPRTLFSQDPPAPPGQCAWTNFFSNLIADDQYLYWVDANGLERLSTNANPGDSPQLLSSQIQHQIRDVELIQDGGTIYALTRDNSANVNASLWSIAKDSGAASLIYNINTAALNLSYDGAYFYWMQDYTPQGYTLEQYIPPQFGLPGYVSPLATNVTAYYAEGARFDPLTSYVFIAMGINVLRYNNFSGSFAPNPVYTSGNPTAFIINVTTDATNLFVLEQRNSVTNLILRAGRSGTGTGEILTTLSLASRTNLTTDGTYLFWIQDGSALYYLPDNAAALPQINMRITGIEITQGIQRPDNSVPLIQGRRTFVRVFVQSDGPAVPGVTMMLYRQVNNNAAGSVLPTNSTGTNLTVQPAPQRANLNDSFLFELPWDWITSSSLTVQAILNPYNVPFENNTQDNSLTQTFAFGPSPRLQVQFVAWGYTLGTTSYFPRIDKDIAQTFSWIRRAYPLASTPGFDDDPSPGFRPGILTIWDGQLGTRVNQTASECTDNKCASAYTNRQMDAMRTEDGLPSSLFFYGMISDAGQFARGQACCGTNVSTGPAGNPAGQGYVWDTDGSYADWYAGHEIGHTLGRNHPATGNENANNCKLYGAGSGALDNSYPWPNAQLGQDDNTEGFDAGDLQFGINRAVLPGTQWHDVMSYCNNQWVSDYTYIGMYNYMTAGQLFAAQGAINPRTVASPRVGGNWLAVYGDVISGTNTATFSRVRHVSSVADIPSRVPGPYSIRLLNANNMTLADYPFTPQPPSDDAPNLLHFTQVITFAAGTRQVRIIRASDGQTLATANVSANPPSVSNVALQSATNPVSGTVTLGWNASDVDGDPLTFDIFYSRDGGATLQPLKLNVHGNTTQLDTTRLGGGTAIFHVIAGDGINTAYADSAPFIMANKSPQPQILTPESGLRIHYGQLVNLSGWAQDFQDGSLGGAQLVWSNQQSQLGTGPQLSVSNLPVGVNTITLTATNSVAQSASASITVIVDDNLNLPGPTLTVGPTQLAWDFPANATQSRTATLDIGNAGSGTLNWTASTNVAGLALSVNNGAAPTSLTLTMNPTGIPTGTTRSGQVTITNSNQPTQVITVPVNIAIGTSFTDPSGYRPQHLYLPIMIR